MMQVPPIWASCMDLQDHARPAEPLCAKAVFGIFRIYRSLDKSIIESISDTLESYQSLQNNIPAPSYFKICSLLSNSPKKLALSFGAPLMTLSCTPSWLTRRFIDPRTHAPSTTISHGKLVPFIYAQKALTG